MKLVMIGSGDIIRTQDEVCRLFNDKYSDRTVSKVAKKSKHNIMGTTHILQEIDIL